MGLINSGRTGAWPGRLEDGKTLAGNALEMLRKSLARKPESLGVLPDVAARP
jgi:hypothetical protein